MKLYDVNGKIVSLPVARYDIDWDGKCRSNIQFHVKQFLKPYWQTHIVFEEFPVFGTRLKVDLLNSTLKIAVEVNGKQHEDFNTFFHKGNPANYLRGIKNDYKKMEWLELNGFHLVEIMEDEVPHISRAFFKDKFDITL
jgi:hypothetical protein